MRMVLPKLEGGENSPNKPPHADPGTLSKTHPRLAESLCSSTWDDGSPKRPARMSLSIYGGRWQVQLDLIGTRLMISVEVPDPILAYDALEAALSLQVVPWQVNPWAKDEAPKKAPKK